ncbi:hypothetical protein REPUB_Repub06bG0077300 [Reevesia pubescens]
MESCINEWSKHMEFIVKHVLAHKHGLYKEVFGSISSGVWTVCFAKTAAQFGILSFLQFGMSIAESSVLRLLGPLHLQIPSHFQRLEGMATVRNLKIKTSTCKRIVKELHSYEKEVEREAAKTADMKDKGADPYDLKQQENVLAESRMMVPDCRKRLEASLADLKGTLAELEEANEKEGPEFEDARSTITEVEKLFQTTEA